MRIFVLGAGFSIPAGMPSTFDLSQRILDEHFLTGLVTDDFLGWLKRFKSSLGWLNRRNASGINIEEFFHYATFEIERYRLGQHAVPIGTHLDTPAEKARTIEDGLRVIERHMATRVLWELQQGAVPDSILRFVDGLRGSGKVVTFNYDLLVERALSERGRKWNHGYALEPEQGTCVLKLHGSIDWIYDDPGWINSGAGSATPPKTRRASSKPKASRKSSTTKAE